MYCKQCGNFIDEKKDKFCMNCGLPIDQNQVEQIEKTRDRKEIKVIYYASEVLSLIFLVLFLVNALNQNSLEAASDFCYAIAMVSLHKIMITKLVTDGETINFVSLVIEKLVGLTTNLFREETYIYEKARRRNTKINLAIMIVFLILAQFL